MTWYLRVLKKYAVFQGRAQRKEYWMFFLFSLIITFVLGFIEGTLLYPLPAEESVLANIYWLAVLIPSFAVGVRRMHDTDHSGWWVIVPFFNFYFGCIDGTSGDNRFGPDPKGVAIGPTKAVFIPDSPTQPSVLSCSECGHENPAEANFCTKCRAKMTLQCNKCGLKSPQGSEFCGSCGEPIGGPAEVYFENG